MEGKNLNREEHEVREENECEVTAKILRWTLSHFSFVRFISFVVKNLRPFSVFSVPLWFNLFSSLELPRAGNNSRDGH